MKASDILTAGAGHLKDREATYDQPGGERSIPNVVTAFNALTGHNLTAEQGWLLLLLLKAGRSQQGAYRADNYEDGAAYFALMGEQAAADRKIPECPVNEVGTVLLPVGYTPYRKGDALPAPGTIVTTIDKQGHLTINRKLGEFYWGQVVGYKVQEGLPPLPESVARVIEASEEEMIESTRKESVDALPWCAQHLCKNKALPGHVVCAEHKIP